MHLINTYLGMMIVFFSSALYIFMMRQAFLSYSKSLKEAAHIDGCSNFRFYWNILLPSSSPIMITIFISSFVAVWNTYVWPMLVTNRNEMRTIQVAITMLNFPDESPHGAIMAAAILILAPSLLVFLIFQRWIKTGMLSGSVKG
jgi:sn-glycerol 3-phosphate transport system permease protein